MSLLICPADIDPCEVHSYVLNNHLADKNIKYSSSNLGGLTPSDVIVIETNLDDFSPEFYELTFERLFEAGALDVYLSPIQMKKGRPATLLSVITTQNSLDSVADILFRETSSFGLRYTPMSRLTLERRWEKVATEFGDIPIKIGTWRGEIRSASPEYDEVKRAAQRFGVPVKTVYSAAQNAYYALKNTLSAEAPKQENPVK